MTGFESILDQKRPIRFLKNFIRKNIIPHALLFTGIDGIGKKKCARIFAMAMNCENGNGDACNSCPSCTKILSSNHPDIIELEPQGNTLKILQIRILRQQLALVPYEAKHRVVIINDAYKMNSEASNSLLKILEEPPKETFFILTAHQPSDLLSTVISRCQHIQFNPISNLLIEAFLIENEQLNQVEAKTLAHLSGGSFAKVFDLMQKKNYLNWRNWIISQLIKWPTSSFEVQMLFMDRLSKNKTILSDALEVMKSWYRDIVIKAIGANQIINHEFADQLEDAVKNYSAQHALECVDAILNTQINIKANANPRLSLEALAIKLS